VHQTVEAATDDLVRNVAAVIGYTAAQVHDDRPFLAVVHPADRERHRAPVRRVDAIRIPTMRVSRGPRTVRSSESAASEGGVPMGRRPGPVYRLGTGHRRDKRAEQALRDSEGRLKEAQRRARLLLAVGPGARRYTLAAEPAEILAAGRRSGPTSFLPYIHGRSRVGREAYLGQPSGSTCVIE